MVEGTALGYLLQAKILLPEDAGSAIYLDIALRWFHLIFGITWIGLLYFFNLVNVPVMKALDAPTKGKVIPVLLPAALWYFRWSAVATVLAGWLYWVLLLHREPQPPDGVPGQYMLRTLGIWFLVVIAAWVIFYLLLRIPPGAKDTPLTRNGYFFAVPVVFLAVVMLWALVDFITYKGASNRVLAIAVGIEDPILGGGAEAAADSAAVAPVHLVAHYAEPRAPVGLQLGQDLMALTPACHARWTGMNACAPPRRGSRWRGRTATSVCRLRSA